MSTCTGLTPSKWYIFISRIEVLAIIYNVDNPANENWFNVTDNHYCPELIIWCVFEVNPLNAEWCGWLLPVGKACKQEKIKLWLKNEQHHHSLEAIFGTFFCGKTCNSNACRLCVQSNLKVHIVESCSTCCKLKTKRELKTECGCRCSLPDLTVLSQSGMNGRTRWHVYEKHMGTLFGMPHAGVYARKPALIVWKCMPDGRSLWRCVPNDWCGSVCLFGWCIPVCF